MEYVLGGSLDRKLDGTPWPSRRAAALVEGLARGVAAAHGLGIVHRDLKPANVLLGEDEAPKITDFGLAKAMHADSGLTLTGSVMGTPTYMAPEQAEGQAKGSGRPSTSIPQGAILYELLTGRPPFRGASLLETLEQVKNSEPVPPGGSF
ncbi:MAG: serine/threonine-protein kinase [Singulisphaera sp.]